MDYNIIRSIIFLVAGLIVILIPKEKLHKFQIYLLKKLHINYNVKTDSKHYAYLGIILIIVSIIIFLFSITN